MNRMAKKLDREAGKVGLEINQRKTKVLVVQPSKDVRAQLGGEVIVEVDWFEYLASVVCNNGDVRKEVSIRTGKAGAAFAKMKRVCNSRGMSLKIKLKLFNGRVM